MEYSQDVKISDILVPNLSAALIATPPHSIEEAMGISWIFDSLSVSKSGAISAKANLLFKGEEWKTYSVGLSKLRVQMTLKEVIEHIDKLMRKKLHDNPPYKNLKGKITTGRDLISYVDMLTLLQDARVNYATLARILNGLEDLVLTPGEKESLFNHYKFIKVYEDIEGFVWNADGYGDPVVLLKTADGNFRLTRKNHELAKRSALAAKLSK